MNKISLKLLLLGFLLMSFSISFAGSDEIIKSAEQRAISATNGFLMSLTSDLSESLKSFDRIKYLDIQIEVQDSINPAVSITNVNKLKEGKNFAFFNQNTLSHNKDEQTINFGLGFRNLFFQDKILFGLNAFYDYAFDDNHRRIGGGLELISSVFDFRSNIYDAQSDIIFTSNGASEEALDGWDARLDYHLPVGFDLRVFGTYFDWENSAETYEEKGEIYGLAGQYGLLKFEAGYRDQDNKKKDAFAKINIVVPLGSVATSGVVSRGMLELVSVRDQLYEPVERENRIRVVKISAGNIVVSGF